eukprot:TRINITY_DN7579_c0_g2_i1.p1 TRINITY_DN7579_c0_g2~~TRINITY_DN7579_c0_g2_i1.p1  ORF type:complete len:223 (+),score=35.38 TRINITY_DN7579_c0_g2_i1:53-721(+)
MSNAVQPAGAELKDGTCSDQTTMPEAKDVKDMWSNPKMPSLHGYLMRESLTAIPVAPREKPDFLDRCAAWQKEVSTPGIMVPSSSALFSELNKHQGFKVEVLDPDSGRKFCETRYQTGCRKVMDHGKLRGKRCYIIYVRRYVIVVSELGLEGWVSRKGNVALGMFEGNELRCEPMPIGWMMLELEFWRYNSLMLKFTITHSKDPGSVGCILKPNKALQLDRA